MIESKSITEDALDVMHILEEDPRTSQRLIAKQSGFSIGKVNYCLKALVDIGYLKLQNYNKSDNKAGYAYVLTPKGIKEKLAITNKFIAIKQQEYDKLSSYINK
tara:strand:- start:1001 stop:1312 length:312 start_codon:yes stop_codon:yes gene_type:complete